MGKCTRVLLWIPLVLAACGARTGLDDLLIEVRGPGDGGSTGHASGGASAGSGSGGTGAGSAGSTGSTGSSGSADASDDSSSGSDAGGLFTNDDSSGDDSSPGGPGCGPANCAGCCATASTPGANKGTCLEGTVLYACGRGGTTCVQCDPERSCSLGICQ